MESICSVAYGVRVSALGSEDGISFACESAIWITVPPPTRLLTLAGTRLEVDNHVQPCNVPWAIPTHICLFGVAAVLRKLHDWVEKTSEGVASVPSKSVSGIQRPISDSAGDPTSKTRQGGYPDKLNGTAIYPDKARNHRATRAEEGQDYKRSGASCPRRHFLTTQSVHREGLQVRNFIPSPSTVRFDGRICRGSSLRSMKMKGGKAGHR